MKTESQSIDMLAWGIRDLGRDDCASIEDLARRLANTYNVKRVEKQLGKESFYARVSTWSFSGTELGGLYFRLGFHVGRLRDLYIEYNPNKASNNTRLIALLSEINTILMANNLELHLLKIHCAVDILFDGKPVVFAPTLRLTLRFLGDGECWDDLSIGSMYIGKINYIRFYNKTAQLEKESSVGASNKRSENDSCLFRLELSYSDYLPLSALSSGASGIAQSLCRVLNYVFLTESKELFEITSKVSPSASKRYLPLYRSIESLPNRLSLMTGHALYFTLSKNKTWKNFQAKIIKKTRWYSGDAESLSYNFASKLASLSDVIASKEMHLP